jgi:hypothetical protein
MSTLLSRRAFQAAIGTFGTGVLLAGTARGGPSDQKPAAAPAPVEAPFERDYAVPSFKPSWKKQQINRLMVQDFVIYGHSEPAMVKKLLDKQPALLNAAMDWGAGDWETAMGGASHMGRRDIVEILLERGARCDLFTATMLGQLEIVKALLTLQPKLIDSKGPHGLTLEQHAKVGGKRAEAVLQYLRSLKSADSGSKKS